MNSYEQTKLPFEAPVVQPPTQIFIGKLIEEEMKARNLSVNWLSARLNCDRRNVYDIYRRAYIDTSLLYRISLALRKNFFKIYSDKVEEIVNQQFTPPPRSEGAPGDEKMSALRKTDEKQQRPGPKTNLAKHATEKKI